MTEPWPYFALIERGWQPRGWAGPAATLERLPFAWFCEQHLCDENKQPWRWEPWQMRDLIEPIWEQYEAVDVAGERYLRPRINHAALLIAKKNGKSTMGGLVGAWGLLAKPESLVLVGAASEDNAKVLGGFMAKAVRRSPFLMDVVTEAGIYRDGTIEIKQGPTKGSLMQIVPGPRGARELHGKMYDILIGDEVWSWEGDAGEEMAEALTLPPERLQDGFCPLQFWFTYPGKHRSISRVLSRTLDSVARGEQPRTFVKHYSAASLEHWRDANPSPRITEEYIYQQRASLLPPQFERMHLCRWPAADRTTFVTPAQVEACTDAGRVATSHGRADTAYLLACDLGLRHDRTAIGVAHIDYSSEPARVVLDELVAYAPAPGETLSIALVEAEIVARAARYWCESIAVDPHQMISTIQRLRVQGYEVTEWVFSAQSMKRLTERLYARLVQGTVRLYPNAGALTTRAGTQHDLQQELAALVLKATDYGYRLDHEAHSEAYSDMSIVLGMLVDVAEQRLGQGQPAVYVVGGGER